MKGIEISRRTFMKASCLTAAAVAAPHFIFNAYATKGGKTLVVVFLRGGFDALNFLVPLTGADRTTYEAARPTLQIPKADVLSLAGTSDFGLHPSAPGLRQLYNDSKLAIVRGFGLPTSDLSHFDAQSKIERGIVDIADNSISTGLLTRAYSANLPTGEPAMPILAACGTTPTSVLGMPTAVTMSSPTTFKLGSGLQNKWQPIVDVATGELWAGPTNYDAGGTNAVYSMELVKAQAYEPVVPAYYGTSTFSSQLFTVFQTIQKNLGCTYAQIDKGGWDSHSNQGGAVIEGSTNFFSDMLIDLSTALSGFYQDLESNGMQDQVTTLVYSEFGRRVEENGSGGTDHGRGGIALALGGAVNGGKMHGSWPGLNDLDGGNVKVVNDYRQLVAEALVDQMGHSTAALTEVFPSYAYTGPIGDGNGVFRAG
ncbi:MAG: DUF1501 domain-containing protein [Burkholderiaceae bacterium]